MKKFYSFINELTIIKLDEIPGSHIAIDSDLANGNITIIEARAMRNALSQKNKNITVFHTSLNNLLFEIKITSLAVITVVLCNIAIPIIKAGDNNIAGAASIGLKCGFIYLLPPAFLCLLLCTCFKYFILKNHTEIGYNVEFHYTSDNKFYYILPHGIILSIFCFYILISSTYEIIASVILYIATFILLFFFSYPSKFEKYLKIIISIKKSYIAKEYLQSMLIKYNVQDQKDFEYNRAFEKLVKYMKIDAIPLPSNLKPITFIVKSKNFNGKDICKSNKIHELTDMFDNGIPSIVKFIKKMGLIGKKKLNIIIKNFDNSPEVRIKLIKSLIGLNIKNFQPSRKLLIEYLVVYHFFVSTTVIKNSENLKKKNISKLITENFLSIQSLYNNLLETDYLKKIVLQLDVLLQLDDLLVKYRILNTTEDVIDLIKKKIYHFNALLKHKQESNYKVYEYDEITSRIQLRNINKTCKSDKMILNRQLKKLEKIHNNYFKLNLQNLTYKQNIAYTSLSDMETHVSFIPSRDHSILLKGFIGNDCSSESGYEDHLFHPGSYIFKVLINGSWCGYIMLIKVSDKDGRKSLIVDSFNINCEILLEIGEIFERFITTLEKIKNSLKFRYILIPAYSHIFSDSIDISRSVYNLYKNAKKIPNSFSIEPMSNCFHSIKQKKFIIVSGNGDQ